MAFAVNDIRAHLQLGGARPTLFQVRLTSNFTSDLANIASFMIQASSLPGSNIPPIEVGYWGRKIKVAGDRVFDDWSVQVMNDEDFKVRHALELWHNKINSLGGNRNTTGSASPSNYKFQAEVSQYSKTGDVVRTYTFYGLFPTQISPIELNWDSTNQIETFQVNFAYDWFEVTAPGNTGTLS
ncbi:MAG: phage tail protein [Alphaproteobacteria bacterium]|nr:phage tail protein [Alphaproteobacteria bacterium]